MKIKKTVTPDELRDFRIEHGLVQERMAFAMGLENYRAIGRWELGVVPIPKWAHRMLELMRLLEAADPEGFKRLVVDNAMHPIIRHKEN
jgi:transcriptional regulator with XRE-family HTH domain